MADLQWQPTLLGDGEPAVDGSFAGVVRLQLDDETWVDHVPGWLAGDASLFDWLAGRPTPVPGWQPDLSRQSEGRISARRTSPPPEADLRVVLER